MPEYDYRCHTCGQVHSVTCPVSEMPSLVPCPACGGLAWRGGQSFATVRFQAGASGHEPQPPPAAEPHQCGVHCALHHWSGDGPARSPDSHALP